MFVITEENDHLLMRLMGVLEICEYAVVFRCLHKSLQTKATLKGFAVSWSRIGREVNKDKIKMLFFSEPMNE